MRMSTRRSPVWRSHEQPTAADERRPYAVRAALSKALADPKTAVTFAGLLLYAVLWSAYAIFYERFGLTPKDLGFGYLDLLAQTAVGTVGLVLVVGALLSIYIVILPVLIGTVGGARRQGGGRQRDGGDRDHHKQTSPSPLSRRASGAAVVAGALVYVWSLLSDGAAHVAALSVTYAVIGVFWLAAVAKWLIDLDSRGRARLQRHLTVGMGVAFLLVAATLLAQAGADADAVRQGRSARPTALGFRLGSWGAERATIRWVTEVNTDTHRVVEGRCLMYLGTSDGTAYVYVPETRETLRLPAAELVIATKDVTVPCTPS